MKSKYFIFSRPICILNTKGTLPSMSVGKIRLHLSMTGLSGRGQDHLTLSRPDHPQDPSAQPATDSTVPCYTHRNPVTTLPGTALSLCFGLFSYSSAQDSYNKLNVQYNRNDPFTLILLTSMSPVPLLVSLSSTWLLL